MAGARAAADDDRDTIRGKDESLRRQTPPDRCVLIGCAVLLIYVLSPPRALRLRGTVFSMYVFSVVVFFSLYMCSLYMSVPPGRWLHSRM